VTDRIPFALPDLTQEELNAVTEAMRSGWVTTGPRVREFESRFASTLGDGLEAVALNSATAGLHLALEAIGIASGDEVLVPTWTFTSTAEVVRYLGAEPVMVDVDPATLNLDLSAAEAAITARTRAVMPVHFAGLAIDQVRLRDFAERNDLRVVEDAAHAFPASYAGVPVGAASSDATVFSFYATKTITTGEGGMLVTRNPDVAARARMMRLHGISRDAFDRYRSEIPAWRYEVVAPGYKYNLTDTAAAMGLVQLRRADGMRDRRASIAATYDAGLADAGLQLPSPGDPSVRHAWHLYVIRLPHGSDRDGFIERLAQRGVGTSVHFIPLHLHHYWRERRNLRPEQFPVASAEFERVVSLPIFSGMTDSQVERVISAVCEERSW
jgi:dTDP-4-amino-4,6-dideoxygalactose transaminase